jgi:diguanylate cyclase (GGDEF)-like protein
LAAINSPQSGDSLIRDALTGAYSRALFQERWPDELERARRYNSSLSLCILDLDYFKTINDSFGHHRGDLILKEFVYRIGLIIRGSDIFFRFGGDEFLLLLPNTGREEAAELCGRILDSIGGTPFPGEPPVTLGSSIGIASFPEDGADGETIFHVADLRCYEAKRRGRNRFIASDLQEKLATQNEPSRLIERDDSLAACQAFLDVLPRMRKGTFIIRGQPSSGKTRFLEEAANLARLRHYRVWRVASAKDTLPVAEDPEAGMVASALDSSAPAFDVIEALLREKGEAGLIAYVDKVESLESPRLRWLEHMLSPDCPFVCAVFWDCSPGTYIDLGSQLTHSVTVELSPLTESGVRVFLRTVLHWDAPEEFLTWFFRQTGGFPKQLLQGIDRLIRQNILQSVSENEWRLSPVYDTIDLREWLTKTSSAPPNNLPVIASSFLGREEEMEQLRKIISNHRLVTLTGPGGIGKSRLAVQAAHYCLSDFPDGAFFVSLAEVRDPELLLPAIAHVLGIPERPNQTIANSVLAYLYSKRMMLILDTIEHISEAAGSVAGLVSSTPQLKVMVTSRQPLHITGEQLYAVPPLSLPAHPESLTPAELARYPAVALFLARAQSVRLDFHLTPENRMAVTELCARLDGIPLAIELAANRISHFSPEEMLAQTSLSLLTRAPTDFPQRHQTLEAVVLWSVDRLSPMERKLFTVLGLFRASFTRDAVAAFIPHEIQRPSDVAESILTLAEHNLLELHVERDGSPRYRMLRPIREIALDLLRQNPEADGLQRKFCEYYLQLTENNVPKLPPLLQKDWLDAMSREHDNALAAIDYLREADLAKATRLTVALCPFWELRTLWSEARSLLNRLLERNGLSVALLVEVLWWASHFARLQGEFDIAETLLRKGMDICKEIELSEQLSRLLQELGWVLNVKGENLLGKQYFLQALALSQKVNDRLGIASAYSNLGLTAQFNAQHPESVIFLEKSLAIYKETNSKSNVAEVLRRLSRADFFLGNYEKSEKEASESLELSREMGDLVGSGHSMLRLGEVARVDGEYEKAKLLLAECANILERAQDREGMMDALLSLADYTRSIRQYDEAIALFKRVLGISRTLNVKGVICRALTDIGEINRHLGNIKEAESYYLEALSIAQEAGFLLGIMHWIHRGLGEIALTKGDPGKALEYFCESLKYFLEEHSIMLFILDISGLIGVYLKQGATRKAASLEGFIAPLLEKNRHVIAADDVEEFTTRARVIRESLPASEWEAALAEGRALSLEKALALALAAPDPIDQTPSNAT